MLTHIKKAFYAYQKNIEKQIDDAINKGNQAPCEKCQANLNKMTSHENFNKEEPTILIVNADSPFEFSLEHTVRLDEHMGMPVITTHDVCEACLTNYYYEFEGFSSDQVYQCKPSQLKTIQDYQTLLRDQQQISIQRFAPYLTEVFRNQSGNVTLYLSLDERLKRSNHESLISFYEKQNIPLRKADWVHAFLSEEEMYTGSRMGGLFEREFLQQVTYPLSNVRFDYSAYHNQLHVEIDIHQIQERQFFDVYGEKFVASEELDFTTIHMIKRNADTYAFFETKKEMLGLDVRETVKEIDRLFDALFETLTATILAEVFGKAYEEFLKKVQKKNEEFEHMMEATREFAMENKAKMLQGKQENPTHLQGFELFDNVQVVTGIYQGMKACIKEIDFNKEEIGIVFFGETNFNNVISLKTEDCIKI